MHEPLCSDMCRCHPAINEHHHFNTMYNEADFPLLYLTNGNKRDTTYTGHVLALFFLFAGREALAGKLTPKLTTADSAIYSFSAESAFQPLTAQTRPFILEEVGVHAAQPFTIAAKQHSSSSSSSSFPRHGSLKLSSNTDKLDRFSFRRRNIVVCTARYLDSSPSSPSLAPSPTSPREGEL